MKKYCVVVKNSVNAVLKVGFADKFFVKIMSIITEEDALKLKKEFECVPLVGRGSVSDEFANLDMDTYEGAVSLKNNFNAKYDQIETTIEEYES